MRGEVVCTLAISADYTAVTVKIKHRRAASHRRHRLDQIPIPITYVIKPPTPALLRLSRK